MQPSHSILDPEAASRPLKIAWAIDPSEMRLVKKTISFVSGLSCRGGFAIHPIILPFAPLPTVDKNERGLEEAQALFETVTIRGLQKQELLPGPPTSRETLAEQFSEWCKDWADFAVATTESRRGLKRLFEGSFTEALCLITDIPLLVINSEFEPGRSPEKIEFAVNERDEEIKHLDRLASLARRLGIPIVLYHKVFSLAGAKGKEIRDSEILMGQLRERIEVIRSHLDKIRQEALEAGVSCDVQIDESDGLPMEILPERTEPSKIVGVISHRGRIASALEGSITRTLLRDGKSPVWVVRAG